MRRSTRKPSPSSARLKKVAIALFLFLTASSLLFLLFSLVSGRLEPKLRKSSSALNINKSESLLSGDTKYTIMIDMGNTGTRAHLFQFSYSSLDQPFTTKEELDRICLKISHSLVARFVFKESATDFPSEHWLKAVPSVSNMLEKQSEVLKSFRRLIKYGVQNIPHSLHDQTPLFIQATAGLRLLAQKRNEDIFDDDDEDVGSWMEEDDEDDRPSKKSTVGVINKTREYFVAESPFVIFDDRSFIRIASGREEGIHSWYSLQLQISKTSEVSLDFGPSPRTRLLNPQLSLFDPINIGTIDMGGGSVQIAYAVHSSSVLRRASIRLENLQLPDQASPISVFSQTFLGFGMYEFQDRFFQKLVDDHFLSKTNGKVKNSCMLRGGEDKIKVRGKSFQVIGTGNYSDCYNRISSLIGFSQTCIETEHIQCALGKTPMPRIPGNIFFLAYEHASRVPLFLGLRGYVSLDDLLDVTKKLCSSPASELANYPRESALIKRHSCFSAVYLYILFSKVFQIPTDVARIGFTEDLDGIGPGWSYGAASLELKRACEKGLLHPSLRFA